MDDAYLDRCSLKTPNSTALASLAYVRNEAHVRRPPDMSVNCDYQVSTQLCGIDSKAFGSVFTSQCGVQPAFFFFFYLVKLRKGQSKLQVRIVMLTGVDRTCTIKLPPMRCESHKTAREGRVLFSAALLRAIHFLSSGSMETLPTSGTVAGERIDLRLRVGARNRFMIGPMGTQTP